VGLVGRFGSLLLDARSRRRWLEASGDHFGLSKAASFWQQQRPGVASLAARIAAVSAEAARAMADAIKAIEGGDMGRYEQHAAQEQHLNAEVDRLEVRGGALLPPSSSSPWPRSFCLLASHTPLLVFLPLSPRFLLSCVISLSTYPPTPA
jgi:hypothetical protein